MKQTKEEREKEQAKIDATVRAVAALLPKGWQASECMALSFMGGTSPSMVFVCRNSKEHNEALRVAPAADRKEIRRRWYQAGAADALVIVEILQAKGFKAFRDGNAVYVKLT